MHKDSKPECFFCKEAGEEPDGVVVKFLGLLSVRTIKEEQKKDLRKK